MKIQNVSMILAHMNADANQAIMKSRVSCMHAFLVTLESLQISLEVYPASPVLKVQAPHSLHQQFAILALQEIMLLLKAPLSASPVLLEALYFQQVLNPACCVQQDHSLQNLVKKCAPIVLMASTVHSKGQLHAQVALLVLLLLLLVRSQI
jgi:hypothetical protein